MPSWNLQHKIITTSDKRELDSKNAPNHQRHRGGLGYTNLQLERECVQDVAVNMRKHPHIVGNVDFLTGTFISPSRLLVSWCTFDKYQAKINLGAQRLTPTPGATIAMLLSYLAHRRACRQKQSERDQRIRSLPAIYHEPLSSTDASILSLPISSLVQGVQSSSLLPSSILTAYTKKALLAHKYTNCLTEILISDAESWAQQVSTSTNKLRRPLAGVPVSLKDMVAVAGYDACMGYSPLVNHPMPFHGGLVQLLLDAGAVPYVKTNIPTTMLSLECANEVWGRSTNPWKVGYGPGGSSGGEGALLAYGGSRIGVGTDVAGSVRAPAHNSGVYSIKSSMFRFPKTGSASSMPGQEGVPATHSPMARTLEDLEYFWKAVMEMKPWEYDHSAIIPHWPRKASYILLNSADTSDKVLHIPWREVTLPENRPIRWGVIWDDGVVAPSPACRRALKMVTDVLTKNGHEVVDISPPSPFQALHLASQLLIADGGETASRHLKTRGYWLLWSGLLSWLDDGLLGGIARGFGTIASILLKVSGTNSLMRLLGLKSTVRIDGGTTDVWTKITVNDPGMIQGFFLFALPRFVKYTYALWLRIWGDETSATLLTSLTHKTIPEYWALISQREAYRARWFEAWRTGFGVQGWQSSQPEGRDKKLGGRFDSGPDFILTVPNALPALPHGGMKDGWKACGYTFMFNLLDYTAGVLPITHVDKALDALPAHTFRARNGIERSNYKMYDAYSMHGLPVGVQVIGKRLEEEKVMEGMKIVQKLMKEAGMEYQLLNA
ncbi:hypothetical protein SERLADRAFT_433136 [Serpula lacrymans var. lacrymans S7.9]|uniref:amidase n=1 Tax=Serpula lacrymans var. lacrymans (strain S7.9) TaxID=578457 RepID=F8NGQ1_SERL9|nr:uncharacterized protein SERLADRAFT_433136 [Serpula lacrymans var. lacrymans S7.9]EGO29133.1 hypothetical protein SERLADRAFT_433136 [Serpula lacrymans var. lacrymans S7.9]